MNDLAPLGGMSDLIADDLLLDRLARRGEAGPEPVAGLLLALAAHADSPLPARTGRRRIANKHRYLGAFAALAVAASGAGVAAAVTLPDGTLVADRGRIAERMEQSARSDAPSALLSRLGLPTTDATTTARGLVLARGADGTIVLLPAAAAAAQEAERRAAGNGAAGGIDAAGAPGAHPVGKDKAAKGKTPTDKAAKEKAAKEKAAKEKIAKDKTSKDKAAKGGAAGAHTPATGNGQTAGRPAGSDPIWVIEPATDPNATAPGTTDPGVTDPGTSDPSTTEPGTTDPNPQDRTVASPTAASPMGAPLATIRQVPAGPQAATANRAARTPAPPSTGAPAAPAKDAAKDAAKAAAKAAANAAAKAAADAAHATVGAVDAAGAQGPAGVTPGNRATGTPVVPTP